MAPHIILLPKCGRVPEPNAFFASGPRRGGAQAERLTSAVIVERQRILKGMGTQFRGHSGTRNRGNCAAVWNKHQEGGT